MLTRLSLSHTHSHSHSTITESRLYPGAFEQGFVRQDFRRGTFTHSFIGGGNRLETGKRVAKRQSQLTTKRVELGISTRGLPCVELGW